MHIEITPFITKVKKADEEAVFLDFSKTLTNQVTFCTTGSLKRKTGKTKYDSGAPQKNLGSWRGWCGGENEARELGCD